MSEEKKIKVVLLEPGKLARTAEIDRQNHKNFKTLFR